MSEEYLRSAVPLTAASITGVPQQKQQPMVFPMVFIQRPMLSFVHIRAHTSGFDSIVCRRVTNKKIKLNIDNINCSLKV